MALQNWSVAASGGYLANDRLSKQIRYAAQPIYKFRQFVSVKEGWGKGKGDVVWFDKIRNVSTGGGTLVETNTMPEDQFTIGTGTIQITEYGNSIPLVKAAA